MVRTEIYDASFFDHFVHMQPEDVSQAVLYALGTAPHVNVSELTLKPVGELF